ncbi:alpha-E domain-containing protein [Dialister sp.]|uniref:alpha-E domain-containing protein n=1 Tax=Dialister sp. TaxID=1955814 RepID=UPI003F0C8C56
MGTLTLKQINRLFWLGRYSERLDTTLRYMMDYYDSMIDGTPAPYDSFCRMLSIPNVYKNEETFWHDYLFDPGNPDSMAAAADRMLDNGVMLRETIGTETFSYIQMAVNNLHKASSSTGPQVELQSVLDDIMAFRGSFDDYINDESIVMVIKVGTLLERVSLYLRLDYPDHKVLLEMKKLMNRLSLTPVRTRSACLAEMLSVSSSGLLPSDRSGLIKAAEDLFIVDYD